MKSLLIQVTIVLLLISIISPHKMIKKQTTETGESTIIDGIKCVLRNNNLVNTIYEAIEIVFKNEESMILNLLLLLPKLQEAIKCFKF